MTDFESIYQACKVSERIFVIHPKFKRANFYSQQLRGLALVEGLHAHNHLPVGKRNCIVIGRGVAGLTISAALATMKAAVLSIDKNQTMLETYAWVVHRELHPNIIFWPFQKLRCVTNLPFMNWSCNKAATVRDQLIREWAPFRQIISEETEAVTGIEENKDGLVKIKCESGRVFESNLVIIAAGFLKEKPVEVAKLKRYWTLYESPPDTEVVISGAGDGGLIETATQFFGPGAVDVTRAIAYAIESRPLKDDIAQVESQAVDLADLANEQNDPSKEAEALQLLNNFYSAIVFERPVRDIAEKTKRVPFVRLVYKQASPYLPYVSPINKVMLALCRQVFKDSLDFEQGEIDVPKPYTVGILTKGADKTTLPLDTLLVRYGADHASYEILTSEDQIKALKESEERHIKTLTGMVADEYNEDIFLRRAPMKIAPSIKHQTEKFRAEVEYLVQALMAHIRVNGRLDWKRPLKNPPRKRKANDKDRLWNLIVKSSGPVDAHLQRLFPVEIQAVRITLTESRRRSFRRLEVDNG